MKEMNLILFFIFMGFSLIYAGNRQEYKKYLQKANNFYQNQEYDSAKVYYSKLISNGITNSTVYYNLGNTWFRKDEIGKAILFWKRALIYDPGNQDIIANIRFAETRTIDKIPVPEKSLVEKVFSFFHSLIPLKAQLWAGLLSLFIISFLLSAAIYAQGNSRLWMIYGASLFSVILCLILISSGIKIYKRENIKQAVILSQSVDAMNQPEGSKILFTVHEGTTVKIKKQRENWLLIQLPNGKGGWLKKSSAGII